MFNDPFQYDVREQVLDWGVSVTCDTSRDQYRKWANDLRGRDMKLAVLCRDLQEAHEALMTYCRSVRNGP